MKGTPAKYLGKIVGKDNFRAYIYATDGAKKLIESWDDFEAHMATGLWFAKKSDASEIKKIKEEQESKPKRTRKTKSDIQETLPSEANEEFLNDDAFGFEVQPEHEGSVVTA